ncbi:unnamed protein product [Ilex paraguariensis]|uniref:Uncharacterized protein n=1 Tax=Ilex paraguariensis TaxID=185542 RepID=A0ABC8TV81_9AQUA
MASAGRNIVGGGLRGGAPSTQDVGAGDALAGGVGDAPSTSAGDVSNALAASVGGTDNALVVGTSVCIVLGDGYAELSFWRASVKRSWGIVGTHSHKGIKRNTIPDSQQGKGTTNSGNSKVTFIFSFIACDDDIALIVSLFHIPPFVMCHWAEKDERRVIIPQES